MVNLGSILGLISALAIVYILSLIFKIKFNRRIKKYNEEQIKNPREYETRGELGIGRGRGGRGGNSGLEQIEGSSPGIAEPKPTVINRESEVPLEQSDGERTRVQDKPIEPINSLEQIEQFRRETSGDNQTVERDSITVPDIEQID